jgi:hypothetical protein
MPCEYCFFSVNHYFNRYNFIFDYRKVWLYLTHTNQNKIHPVVFIIDYQYQILSKYFSSFGIITDQRMDSQK